MEQLVLIGASGLAREIIAGLSASSTQKVVGVVDDAPERLGDRFAGVPVVGRIDDVAAMASAGLVICVGSGSSRERIADRLARLGVSDDRYATVIDSSVRNPGPSPVGFGSVLLSHVTVTADATIGNHVVMMPGVTVTHDDVVEDFATIAAGVSLGGGVRIGRAAYVGMNASVRQGIQVGAHSTLGMGAALLADLPENQIWVGVPARPIDSEPA